MGKTEEQVRAELRQEMEAELAKEREAEATMRKRIRTEERERIETELKRHGELVAFAEEVCGGEGGQGLSEPVDEIVAFLEAVPEAAREQAQRILRAKVVDFGEMGTSREGAATLIALPAAYAPLLEMWLEDGHELAAWFAANVDEVGEMGQYDLAAFKKAEG